jgi:hypothetical protein
VAVRATQTDMMKFLQIIVYCALVVMFHELDRTIPISAALIVALCCTALIFAPLLHLELWLLSRRAPPFEQGRQESGPSHVLPGGGGAAHKLIAEDRLPRPAHGEITKSLRDSGSQ